MFLLVSVNPHVLPLNDQWWMIRTVTLEPPWERLALRDPRVRPFSEVYTTERFHWRTYSRASVQVKKELIGEGIRQGIWPRHSAALTAICLGLLDNGKKNEGSLDGLWSMQILCYMSSTLEVSSFWISRWFSRYIAPRFMSRNQQGFYQPARQ